MVYDQNLRYLHECLFRDHKQTNKERRKLHKLQLLQPILFLGSFELWSLLPSPSVTTIIRRRPGPIRRLFATSRSVQVEGDASKGASKLQISTRVRGSNSETGAPTLRWCNYIFVSGFGFHLLIPGSKRKTVPSQGEYSFHLR